MENAYDDNLLRYAARKGVESIRGKREFIIKITFDKDKNIYTKRISLSDTNISFGEQWGKYRSDDELPDFVELKINKDWNILSSMQSNNKMYIKFSYNLYERFAVSYWDSDGWEERSLFAGFDYIIKNYNPDSYYEFSLSGSSKALDFN